MTVLPPLILFLYSNVDVRCFWSSPVSLLLPDLTMIWDSLPYNVVLTPSKVRNVVEKGFFFPPPRLIFSLLSNNILFSTYEWIPVTTQHPDHMEDLLSITWCNLSPCMYWLPCSWMTPQHTFPVCWWYWRKPLHI